MAFLGAQNNYLQEMMKRYGAESQPNFLDVSNALIQSRAENTPFSPRSEKTFDNRVQESIAARTAPMRANIEAQESVYNLMSKAAEQGNASAKRVIDLSKEFAGDDPNDLNAVMTKLQEYEQRDGVDLEGENPLPYIMKAVKETGVKPFNLRAAELEARQQRMQSEADLRNADFEIKRQALDLKERELSDPSTSSTIMKMGKLPEGSYFNPETGRVEPIPGLEDLPDYMRKETAPGRALPDSAMGRLEKYRAPLDETERLLGSFDDKYAGKPIIGEFDNAFKRTFGDDTGQAQWWQDYQSFKNNVRHELFGASLTSTEKAEFEKAIVSPGMAPSEVKKNLKRQKDIIAKSLARVSKVYEAGGYSKDQLDIYRGGDGAASEGSGEMEIIRDPQTGKLKKKVNDDLGFIMNELENNPKAISDINNSPVQYGINQAYNKGVEVGSLTEDQAREHYKKEYNLDGFVPANASDAFKLVAQDAVIHHGKDKDTKRLIDMAGGDPYKLLQLRYEYMQGIPKLQPQMKGLKNRLNKLARKIGEMESA